ncbi:dephospho-CoA kinase [Leifsonia sp. A12D58]|uniref:dephospho-CoA kinase n=1 Tax=Leifsonia sp. A12D58 TaxID=3397674 RepID=UPI0039E054B7
MYLIGLTGGIASGKSTVASRFAQHGAVTIDADKVARDVVEPGTPALAEIEAAFGPGVITEDGRLDRPALGAIVFNDSEALSRLNSIVHPAVKARTAQLFADAETGDPDAVVVYDVPLLVEAAPGHAFDLVVVTHAPEDVRVARMIELRGMSEADARARISSQATDADRLAIADVVIDTSGTLEDTEAQVDEAWNRITVRGAP